MIPLLIIIVFAIFGFFTMGPLGVLIGGAVGYFTIYFIGNVVLKKDKGLVPYKDRLVIANDMIKADRATVEAYSMQKDTNAIIEFIATDIEQLFRESFNINKVPKNYWLSYPVIIAIIISRVEESSGVEKKYNKLLKNSIKLMYPAHKNDN